VLKILIKILKNIIAIAGLIYCDIGFFINGPVVIDGLIDEFACFRRGRSRRSSPSISTDGTIYFGSNDGYLYSLYPDGTLKGKISACHLRITPTLGADGLIYMAGTDGKISVFNPDGTLKWGCLS